MPDNKYFLIINPVSHSGKAIRESAKIFSILKKRNTDFDFKYTRKPFEATEIALAARKDYPVLIAVGGDGTICEVITGIFIDNEFGPKPKLGVLHIGTSPDFNKYHKIPLQLEEAIDVILKGKTKSIDIGKITYCSESQGQADIISYFASNVNVGLGPLIAGKANSRYRKYLGDFLGTLSSLLVSLLGFKKLNLQIKIDGKTKSFSRLINLTVGKDPFLASGMRVFSQIKPDDGKLYILSIEMTAGFKFFCNIPKLYWGNFLDYKGAQINYGSKVQISYCDNYPWVEFDGDLKGHLPATIEVLPKALEVLK